MMFRHGDPVVAIIENAVHRGVVVYGWMTSDRPRIQAYDVIGIWATETWYEYEMDFREVTLLKEDEYVSDL